MIRTILEEAIDRLHRLPDTDQEQVVKLIRALESKSSRPATDQGAFAKFFGSWPAEEAARAQAAIDDAFGRIDPDEHTGKL